MISSLAQWRDQMLMLMPLPQINPLLPAMKRRRSAVALVFQGLGLYLALVWMTSGSAWEIVKSVLFDVKMLFGFGQWNLA